MTHRIRFLTTDAMTGRVQQTQTSPPRHASSALEWARWSHKTMFC